MLYMPARRARVLRGHCAGDAQRVELLQTIEQLGVRARPGGDLVDYTRAQRVLVISYRPAQCEDGWVLATRLENSLDLLAGEFALSALQNVHDGVEAFVHHRFHRDFLR